MTTKKSTKLKIVFFGTSDRSIPILRTLKRSFDLRLCITKTDRKLGRNQILKETAVKTWAKKNNITFLAISSLKEEDLQKVLKKIEKVKPDYGVVADFSFIIPSDIIKLFGTHLINIHFSLLPKYRGASPVQFAILDGNETTGITFHIVEDKMDSGNIISQIGYKMYGKETSGELYDTLFKIAAEKLPKILKEYSLGRISPLPQDRESATFTFSKTNPQSTFVYKEDAQIDWNNKPQEIERQIRAFNPWPIAWSFLGELERPKYMVEKIKLKKSVSKKLKIKIYSSSIIENKLVIEEIQVEGKNKTKWEDFRNGYLIIN